MLNANADVSLFSANADVSTINTDADIVCLLADGNSSSSVPYVSFVPLASADGSSRIPMLILLLLPRGSRLLRYLCNAATSLFV